ncbi:MAG: ABC transporter substrate-binding protein [Dehalococcoidia bacterium]
MVLLYAVLIAALVSACGGSSSSDPSVTAPSGSTPTVITGTATATAVPADNSAPTTPPLGNGDGPSGSIVITLSGVGPDNYELHQLAWPWNDRNQFLGIYDTIIYDDRRAGVSDLIQPSVASEWEFTDDALILTLRTDIPWHDSKYGNLTTEDVLWSLERASSEGTRWTRAEALTTNFNVDQLSQTGPNEITMPWNERDLRWRTVPRDLTLQSKKMFDDIGAEAMNLEPMGSGPYRVTSHRSDDHINLEAVPDHWRETAFVRVVEILDVPEETIRVAMLANGEADVIQMGMQSIPDVNDVAGAGTVIGPLTGKSGAQIVPSGQYYQTEDENGDPTERTPLTELPWVGENPDDGVKVRRAMAMAIDRDAIVETILGGVGAPHYLWNLGPGHPRWTDEMQQEWGIPYDPPAARDLLADAGYPDGFEFDFFIPSGLSSTLEQVCQSMLPMFQSAGMTPRVDTSAYSSVRPKMLARTMDVVWCWEESGWNVDPDPLYRFSTRAVWNPGVEYPEPQDFESRILGTSDSEAAWDTILHEWLPWFDDNLPTFQTVSYTPPMGTGQRVGDWDMRIHHDRWPRDPWLIRLK